MFFKGFDMLYTYI